MAYSINYMGNLITFLDATPRSQPLEPMVQAVGYLPRRSEVMDCRKSMVFFSFILSGRGEFVRNGQPHAVCSPCVFIQEPNIPLRYGPKPVGGTWEELFLQFNASQMPLFAKWGIDSARHPVWPLAAASMVRSLAEELIDCLPRAGACGVSDRIDRIAHRLLLESRIASSPAAGPNENSALIHIRRYLASNLELPHDFDALARQYGMSLVSFRRHWVREFGKPPAEDLTDLRIREACRLLETTTLNIKKISGRTGFRDPLYFSRRFSNKIGVSPARFRRQCHA